MINLTSMKIFTGKVVQATMVLGALVFALPAMADSVGPVTFEPTAYTVGSINGQNGWSATGSAGSGCALYDEGVSDNSAIGGTPSTFGTQSFRISNAVTSGCFGDQAFAPALTAPAGETGADNGTYGAATPVPHFEASFDIFALPGSTGDTLSVAPDRGDGARMTYLRFENPGDDMIHVYFDDVTDPTHAANADTFNEYQIAQLNPSVPHTIKFTIDFVNGPDNDVVNIYIDNKLTFTGTTWEDYYRFDAESNPTLNDAFTPTVRTVLFRAGGAAVPANAGKGYLIDNFSAVSGQTTSTQVASCPSGMVQSAAPVETVVVNSNSSTPIASLTSLTNGQPYLMVASGTWQNGGLNVADVAYASLTSWLTHMQGYNIAPYFLGQGEFQLQVNGNFVNWGSYNPSHAYSYLFTGAGAPANFLVFDGDSNTNAASASWYGDNSGSESVAIYSCTTPAPVAVVPTDKKQCMNNGWKSYVDNSGTHFKNQGDCVSFVATKGKNTAAGK